MAVVTDGAAYCTKAYREVLSPVFPKSTHILCLAHVVNLGAEIFRHYVEFSHTSDLITMIKSSLFKKPGRKCRFLKYLGDFIPSSDVKLPPVPVSTRWNSWFEAAIYHATRVHIYEGFYKQEKSVGMAVERIIELLTHKEIYPEIVLQLYFIKENCQRLMNVLTALEEKKIPLACKVFNLLEDLVAYLIKSFKNVFALSVKKIEGHLDKLPVYKFYKAVCVFDPRQLPIVKLKIHHPNFSKSGSFTLSFSKVLFLLLLSCVHSGKAY